jgi:pyruvate formate lyase activating enzyme
MTNIHKYTEAAFWAPEGDRIRCYLCPHACLLQEGQTGICGVRSRLDGKLRSSVYGSPAAIQIDPIEKKPLYHFLPGSRTFSIGTMGCNLSCLFCQNWHLSTRQVHDDLSISPEYVVEKAIETECASIAFTYNEPTVFAEYAMEIRDIAAKQDLPCILVSNGFITPQARKDLYSGIRAVNIDLKGFSENIYSTYCGGKLMPVLDTISYCIEKGIHTEITTLLIPGVNDDESMLKEEFSWIVKNCGKNTPLHLSAFHPTHKMMDHPPTSRSILERAKQTALECGLNYIYIGNYPGFDNNTLCPECGQTVIDRHMGKIRAYIPHEHDVPIIWSIV